ncbi:MAG: DNA adenine methylase [Propionicimonas sp.]|uniref:DNA adenine methylase n=1 Tax=Propionicimonas sp. TaxID=1955623 RepID=UPI003D0DC204
MGSKTALLGGPLGEILLREASGARRFVDLFAGSGAVAHFVSQKTDLPVLSVDLQEYARVLTAAITERTTSLAGDTSLKAWISAASARAESSDQTELTAAAVKQARAEASATGEGFITRHYGGYYFSPGQARMLDYLHSTLPESEPVRTVALSALLQAASVCAAAPGHTAQPFQPTKSLLPYIATAWSRSVTSAVSTAVEQIAPAFARQRGTALVGDAGSIVATLDDGDLVFCDPPYSAAQYSRFYHVLEGIARGGWDDVTGSGRAPDRSSRKTSDFSMKSKARAAMKGLLDGLRIRGCRAVVTFPDADASNGLSGQEVIAMATRDWSVEAHYVESIHSTLGGSSDGGTRGGRKKLKEAVIVLTPRSPVLELPLVLSQHRQMPDQRPTTAALSA